MIFPAIAIVRAKLDLTGQEHVNSIAGIALSEEIAVLTLFPSNSGTDDCLQSAFINSRNDIQALHTHATAACAFFIGYITVIRFSLHIVHSTILLSFR